jgi:hypothetical protein
LSKEDRRHDSLEGPVDVTIRVVALVSRLVLEIDLSEGILMLEFDLLMVRGGIVLVGLDMFEAWVTLHLLGLRVRSCHSVRRTSVFFSLIAADCDVGPMVMVI